MAGETFGADARGRFAQCSEEAGASKAHQEAVLTATTPTDTIRTIIYTVSLHSPLGVRVLPFSALSFLFLLTDMSALTIPPLLLPSIQGRPLRVRKTPFILDWEKKPEEIKRLADKGIIAVGMEDVENRPHLMGTVGSEVNEILPAKVIVEVSFLDSALGAGSALTRDPLSQSVLLANRTWSRTPCSTSTAPAASSPARPSSRAPAPFADRIAMKLKIESVKIDCPGKAESEQTSATGLRTKTRHGRAEARRRANSEKRDKSWMKFYQPVKALAESAEPHVLPLGMMSNLSKHASSAAEIPASHRRTRALVFDFARAICNTQQQGFHQSQQHTQPTTASCLLSDGVFVGDPRRGSRHWTTNKHR